jgi:hypothetical protein
MEKIFLKMAIHLIKPMNNKQLKSHATIGKLKVSQETGRKLMIILNYLTKTDGG